MNKESIINNISEETSNGKALLGKDGWLFLVGDTNRWLYQQFGVVRWTKEEVVNANAIISARKNVVNYWKFIIPEKSVIYPEYLPDPLNSWCAAEQRPANLLASATYIYDQILAGKPFGLTYFRGDTHLNWLGSYFAYKAIVEKLGLSPYPLAQFAASVAAWDGDLFHQLTGSLRERFLTTAHPVDGALEGLLRYDLKQRVSIEIENDYHGFSRPSHVYECSDKSLPRMVMFRDSTSELFIPWLADHFSRSVFIWNAGNVIDEVLQREKPDIVLHVMAERFVLSYPWGSAFL
jgi:hypothetical protein